MKIGIIAAMDSEFESLLNNLEEKKETELFSNKFYSGKMGKNDVVIVRCGIGKVNSAIIASLLISNFKPELVINSGIAGGGTGVSTGDFMIADELIYSDVDVTAFGYELGQIPGMPLSYKTDSFYKEKLVEILKKHNISYKDGVCLTADTFRLSAKEIKNKLPLVYGCEMEGASIAQACYKLNTKFLSLRIISDVLDSTNHMDDYNAFEAKAAKMSADLTIELIKNL